MDRYQLALLLLFIALGYARTHPLTNLTGDDVWSTAISKGTILHRQLQSGCYPDKENPITREQLVARGWNIGDYGMKEWPPRFSYQHAFRNFVMDAMRWTQNTDYWTTGLECGKDYAGSTEYTQYFNMYSPQNGLIAALDLRKAAGEKIFWSDGTFALWQAVTSFTRSDIRFLRYIVQSDISNPITKYVIHRIVPKESDSITVLDAGTDGFLALLGTPNGVGGVHLLMEHKRALGYKTIARAIVFRKGHRPFPLGSDVVFQVQDMPSPLQGHLCSQ